MKVMTTMNFFSVKKLNCFKIFNFLSLISDECNVLIYLRCTVVLPELQLAESVQHFLATRLNGPQGHCGLDGE
jgi:hypothetical protein